MIMMLKQHQMNQKDKQAAQQLEAEKYAKEAERWQKTHGLALRKQGATEEYNQRLFNRWDTPEVEEVSTHL